MKTSEEFYSAAITAGSICISCEFCGKTYFATGEDYLFEEGELEELIEKAKKEPEKYIEHDEDKISWGILNGKQFVYECCDEEVYKFEQFIWNHRYIIASYLKSKADKLKREAEMAKDNADKVKEI